MSKQVIAVLFGGQSSEHVVSCMSAINIIKCINKDKYDIILIGITKDGKWLKVNSIDDIVSESWREGKTGAYLLPDAKEKSLLITEGSEYTKIKISLVFPILHGLYGEDGTIQGLCELAQIPYVGCDVISSALSMDKSYTKLIVDRIGIRQAAYKLLHRHKINKDIISAMQEVEAGFEYPVFVKPANAGSSKGVNMANNTAELKYALEEALLHDKKVLVEEAIVGREFECAVLGTKTKPIVSGVGEIISAGSFYDFDSKYYNSDSKTVLDPDLDGETIERIRKYSKIIFRAMDCHGLARVDFFLSSSGEVIFNEINTMPGFSNISMYPMLWEAKGIDKYRLIQSLIDLAYERE